MWKIENILVWILTGLLTMDYAFIKDICPL